LPMMIVSFALVPLMIPMTSQIGLICASIKLVRIRVVPVTGPVLYVASNPPVHPSRPISFPGIPWLSRGFRSGKASRWEMGKDGILGRFCGLLTRSTPGFDGYPGVVGSPGYLLMYATDPRWIEEGCRAKPSASRQRYVSKRYRVQTIVLGYAACPFASCGPSSPGSLNMTTPTMPCASALRTFTPRNGPPYFARAILPVRLTLAAASAAKSSL
jgi:hypothetical protein